MSGILRPEKAGHTPMKMTVSRSDLLQLINLQLKREGKPELPQNAQIVVKVPGGGDWSGEYLDLDDKEQVIDLRWKA